MKEEKTYRIITGEVTGMIGIKCLICGKTSWHPDDVKNLYCGNCHHFHKTMMLKKRISRSNIKEAVKKILWMARRYADGRETYAPDMFNDAYDILRAELGDDIDLASTWNEKGEPVYDISLKNSHIHPYAVNGYKDEFSRQNPKDSQLVQGLKQRKFYIKPKLIDETNTDTAQTS